MMRDCARINYMYLSVSFAFKSFDAIVVDHTHSEEKMINEA